MKKLILLLLISVVFISTVTVGASAAIITEHTEYYSSVDNGWVTSVKNQGSSPLCLAYSIASVVETQLIKKGYADENINLSELHMAYCYKTITPNPLLLNKEDYDDASEELIFNEGFSQEKALYALTMQLGLKEENETNCYGKSRTLLQTITRIPSDKRNLFLYNDDYVITDFTSIKKNVSDIKKAILKYGSILASYKNDSFNKNYSYVKDASASNHAVAVVGWDDSIPKELFKNKNGEVPPDNGGWIVKNSWGTSETKSGYTYISYYDASSKFTAINVELKSKVPDNCYMYDSGSNPVFFARSKYANVFTSDSNEILKQIGFAARADNVEYTLSIYKNCTRDNPQSGTLIYKENLKTKNNGYEVVNLSKDINLPKGTRYSVVIESNDFALVAIEKDEEKNAKKFANAEKGESFIYDEYQHIWNDCSYSVASYLGNLIIRAYTDENCNSKNIAPADVKVENIKYTYNGKKITPTVTVTVDGKQLQKNKDYTVTYSNNINAGTASVVVTGMNNYNGTIKKSFTINKKSISSVIVSNIPKVYDGQTYPSSITVKDGSKNLVCNKDYKVLYPSQKVSSNCPYITISGIGNYSGTKKISLTVADAFENKEVSGIKATVSQNNITIKWNKLSDADGYLVYKLNGSKWERVSKQKGTSFTFKNLAPGSKFNFYVRAYKTVNGKAIYSKYKIYYTYSGLKNPVLKGRKMGQKTILQWNNVQGTEYHLYKYNYETKKWSVIKKLPANTRTFVVNNNEKAVYAVIAYKTIDKKKVSSGYSNYYYVK